MCAAILFCNPFVNPNSNPTFTVQRPFGTDTVEAGDEVSLKLKLSATRIFSVTTESTSKSLSVGKNVTRN